jgi:hypothetical protein
MRRLYLLITIFIGFTLSGCAVTNPPSADKGMKQALNQSTLPEPPAMKSPFAVAVYSKGVNPGHPYKVIAKETVSKYNKVGIKRQEAVIHDALRNLAASVGGDAVVNITLEENKVTGEVVRFENKSVG